MLNYNLEIIFYFMETHADLHAPKLGLGIAVGMLASLPAAAAPELDAFGRPFKEENMIPAKSPVCSSKDELDVAPVFVHGVKPLYPINSNLSRKTGAAVIDYRVEADGKTTVVSSKNSGTDSDKKWFGNHAMIAVGSWIFEPGMRGGAPVPVACKVRFEYGFR